MVVSSLACLRSDWTARLPLVPESIRDDVEI